MDPNNYLQPNLPQQPGNDMLPPTPGQAYQQGQSSPYSAGAPQPQPAQPAQWQQSYAQQPQQLYQAQPGAWQSQAPTGQQQMSAAPATYSGQMGYAQQPSVQPWAAQNQYTQPVMNPGYYDQPKSGHKKVLLWIIISFAVLMLLLGVALMLGSKNKNVAPRTGSSASTTQSASSSDQAKYKASTAESLNDYSAVCDGGTISNSTDYSTGPSPHPIVLFEPSLTEGRYIESSIYFTDANWEADYKTPASAQLVGCMKRKSVGDSTKTCDFQDSDKQAVSLKLYPVSYTLTIYEAKSGKKLNQTEIWGPATSCPSVAAYSKNDPKLYGYPDKGQVTEAVRTFITKN
ncbi:hypothetical protein JNM87_03310 [Candidatus Saccharibacteria bacterium]|nr:hypothetical protein [Candidatus Saccharibacteria bacterium]